MAIRERGLLSDIEEKPTTLRDPLATVLAYSPVGRVPALVLSCGTTLTETTLILKWLDGYGTAPSMLPTTAQGFAEYGRVVGLLDGVAVWNRELRRPESERSTSVLCLETLRANRVADRVENDVANGAYSELNAAYLTLAALLGYLERRHTVWHWRENRPHLDRWFASASKRISFGDTIPPLSGI